MLAILLSTYNGSKFLREQLDSLLAQTYDNFIIWVRDDGSTDSSKEIIEEYKDLYPDKLYLVDWESFQNLGFGASFLRLLEVADGDLYFYCDQDDIWEINKLEVMANYYQNHADKSIPYLLHSDMSYLGDDSLKGTSFFELTSYVPEKEEKFLFRGFLPGCSMALNQQLKDLCLCLKYKSSHDFLAYFMARAYGQVALIKSSLIKYRVHEENTVGIGKTTPIIILVKDFLKHVFNSSTYRTVLLTDYYQFADIMRRQDDKLIELEVYKKDELEQLGFWERKKWHYDHFAPLYLSKVEVFFKMLTF